MTLKRKLVSRETDPEKVEQEWNKLFREYQVEKKREEYSKSHQEKTLKMFYVYEWETGFMVSPNEVDEDQLQPEAMIYTIKAMTVLEAYDKVLRERAKDLRRQ